MPSLRDVTGSRGDVGGTERLDEGPVTVLVGQPAEAPSTFVKQVLLPVVAGPGDLDVPDEMADDVPLGPPQPALRSQGQDRLDGHSIPGAEDLEVLLRIEERAAPGAADSLRLVGEADLQGAGALRTGERLGLRCGGQLLLVGQVGLREAELAEGDLSLPR